jgi:glutathione S-transferase
MNITVHHLNNSKSQRVLWVLEELELPYEVKYYKRQPTGMAAPELKGVHPLGKAPAVEVDGVTIAESAAVSELLVRRYGKGKLAPALDSPDYPHYLEMLHYPEASASMVIVMAVFASVYGLGSTPESKALIMSQAEQHIRYIESILEKTPYLTGNAFTVPDTQITFILQMARDCSDIISNRPVLLDYLQRMEARPAYQRAVERGGPFSLKFF